MRYRVDLTQNVTEAATVEVEACNRQEAEQKALDLAEGITHVEGYEVVDWKFIEVDGDIEVIGCEVIEPPSYTEAEIKRSQDNIARLLKAADNDQ